jgi:hypothetical protein
MSNEYSQGLLLDPLILTEAQVLAIYNKAYSLLLQGQIYMSFDGQGTSFTTKFPITVSQMLSEARYCLKQINPARYGHITSDVMPFFI